MGDEIGIMPGFRFYPTEEELVSCYLLNKLKGTTNTAIHRVIPVVDIYNYNPWDLPKFGGVLCPEDSEQWFFFVPRQERESRGGRPTRLTADGFWKATGSPAQVYSRQNNTVIGRKRTMVFYMGRAPQGSKTAWKMNEYKAIMFQQQVASSSSSSSTSTAATLHLQSYLSDEFSLCRIHRGSRKLGAFDRRPPSEVVAAALDLQQHHSSGDATMGQEITANINPSEGNENIDLFTSVDLESSWEYEEIKWLFDI